MIDDDFIQEYFNEDLSLIRPYKANVFLVNGEKRSVSGASWYSGQSAPINDLALSFICESINQYSDRDIVFDRSIVEFAATPPALVASSPIKAVGFASHIVLLKFFNNPNISLTKLSKLYESFFIALNIYDKYIEQISAGWMNLVGFINSFINSIQSAEYILSSELIYFSYGQLKRNTYCTYIDFAYIDSNGKFHVYLLTPNGTPVRQKLSGITNIRILQILKYYAEANVSVSTINEVLLPYSYSQDKIVVANYNVSSAMISASNSFYTSNVQIRKNIGFCSMCPYFSKCSLKDVL